MNRISVSILLALFVALALVACTPAAGRPATFLNASVSDVISEIAAYGITLQPSENFDFYSIETIGDRFITLYAENTLGMAILLGRQASRLTFSATESEGGTLLAASGRGTNAGERLDQILAHLTATYNR